LAFETAYSVIPYPKMGNDNLIGGTNVSLIVLIETQRSKFTFAPALSFVPDPPGTAKRLLPHNRSGGFIIDIKITG
jgi:hypothetical protein